MNDVPFAQSQSDIVNQRTPDKPKVVTESIRMPALNRIHLLTDEELQAFLYNALRARANLLKVEISLGEYEGAEKQVNIPYANKLFNLEMSKIASVLAMALRNAPNVCKITAEIGTLDGEPFSRVFIKYANKTPVGPELNAFGEAVSAGDEEFNPTLKLTYRPL